MIPKVISFEPPEFEIVTTTTSILLVDELWLILCSTAAEVWFAAHYPCNVLPRMVTALSNTASIFWDFFQFPIMTNIIHFGNESRKFKVLSLAVKICSLPGNNQKYWQTYNHSFGNIYHTIAAKWIKQQKTEMPDIAQASQGAGIQEPAGPILIQGN